MARVLYPSGTVQDMGTGTRALYPGSHVQYARVLIPGYPVPGTEYPGTGGTRVPARARGRSPTQDITYRTWNIEGVHSLLGIMHKHVCIRSYLEYQTFILSQYSSRKVQISQKVRDGQK